MMRSLAGLIGLALLILAAAPATAAIGTPVNLGQANSGSSTITGGANQTISVSGTAGLFTVAVFSMASGVTAVTCSDNAANSGWVSTAIYLAANGLKSGACYNPNPAAGFTVLNLSPNVSSRMVSAAAQVSGVATASPLDVTGAGQDGTNTSASVAAGTLGQAEEIVFGVRLTANTDGGETAAGLANALTGSDALAGNIDLAWAYTITASISGPTYAPTWVTSRPFSAQVWSFKAAIAPASGGQGLLMGVGR